MHLPVVAQDSLLEHPKGKPMPAKRPRNVIDFDMPRPDTTAEVCQIALQTNDEQRDAGWGN